MVMSYETSARGGSQKREKSNTGHSSGGGKQTTHKIPQATAEQMRIAQLVNDQPKDDDILLSKNVSQIVEVTGTSEENALLALYDSSNDPIRAIELILERGSKGEDSGWETAGRRKNRGGSSMTRGQDTFDDETKDDKTNENRREWDGGESRGRGRGNRRGGRGRGGRNQDRTRTTDDNDKENENFQDRGQRRGRGRGRSGTNRGRGGRGRGGGAPRHYKNQTFGSKYGDDSNAKDSLTEPVDMWRGTSNECWDIEVGTWTSEDAKKQKAQKEKSDSFGDNWGTESWNDELTETKVFQAQNIQLPPVQSITGNNNAPDGGGQSLMQSTGDNTMTNHYPSTTPQTGERIDLGLLFKKSGNSSMRAGDNTSSYGSHSGMGYGNTPQSHSVPQHTAPNVIQQLQQQGQSNSLFSESNSSASRLFSDYDQRGQQQQTPQQPSATDSLFKQNEASVAVDSSYSQLNGKLAAHSSQPKNISSSSSFLDSFSGLGGASQSQSGMLGQLADLSSKQTSMSSYSQVRQQPNTTVGNRGDMNSFSQGQQKQATDAVKASLGIPIGGSQSSMRHGPGQVQSNVAEMQNQGSLKDESHLSFGSPLPPQINQQSKQQRKKMPSLPPKIPASAVEMPGNSAYNTQFSLQFGADDSAPPMDPSSLSSSGFDVGMPHNGGSQNIMAQQRSLFMNNDVSSEKQQTNHLSSSVPDQSLFSQSAQQMTPTKNEMQRNQENVMMPPGNRMVESSTVTGTSALDAPTRAPPGLTIPASASSALSSLNAGGGGHVGSGRHGNDLGSAYNAPNDHMASGRSLDSSLNQVSSLSSSFSQVHSYYSTTPSGSQKPGQQIQSELSSGRSLHSPVPSSSLPGSLQSSPMPKMMQMSGNTPVKDPNSNMESAVTSLSNMSSLATSLSQVSIASPAAQQHHHHGTGPSAINQSSMLSSALSTAVSTAMPYSASSLSTSVSRGLSDSISSGTSMGKSGYDATQDSMSSFSSSYTSTPSSVPSSAMLTQSQQSVPSQTPSTVTTIANMQASGYNAQTTSTLSSSTLGGFATAKMPHPITNKAPVNMPPGVTTPILPSQYGIPMAGLMPYTPDMQYGYDQLLLAQSRVINPLQNYYDMHFHNNTQNAAVNGRDSTAQVSSGQSKYNREPSSPTPTASQLQNLSGSMGSGLSQHNSSVSQQSTQLKGATIHGSQTAGHHSAQQQQQFVGAAMPAYAGYSSLAAPYYGLGMPNTAGFQYPPTMFAAAMHQAPKHSVNTTTGFQQPTTGFGHSYSNATITSSSGLQDLQGSNYSKTHASAFEKQQGYHQHTNTPPPFNLQAITAAVAAGGGATTGGGAPGLSPYGTAPYMTMLQPHQASQQQAIHLLQQQHQDATGGQPIGSQRNLGSNSLVKSANKQSAYGNVASGYWGN
ncbi:uncharacterized protein LOC120333750 isoform X1 [Styela clava]